MPPFTREMAKRHKKGLSAKQQRQWVQVARSAYDSCKKKGGSDSDCEASAIIQANGVTGTPAMKANALQTHERRLVIQAALTVAPHRMTLHNREHLVAPAVLIVEGVLNGAYIPGTSLQADMWDFVPIVINHPLNELGTPISARTPEVYDQYGIGHVYRAQVSTGTRKGTPVRSLRAELWLDMDRIELLGGEALQALEMVENELPLECSTGFYSEAIPGLGVFQDVPYVETLVGVRPDHLALLPNSIGACSWGDGCGLPRLHQTTAPCACTGETCTCAAEAATLPGHPADTATPRVSGWRGFVQMLRAFVNHEDPAPHDPDDAPPDEDGEEDATGDEEEEQEPAAAHLTPQADLALRDALERCLIQEMGAQAIPCWVVEVDAEAQSFTCEMGGVLLRRYWTQDGDGLITLTPDTDEVQRQTDYVTVPGTSGPADAEENDPMTMQGTPPTATVKARVSALIAQERSGWTERDRPILERMDEATLIRLEQQPIHPAPTLPHVPTTMDEAIATMPHHLREPLQAMSQEYESRKQQAITVLAANKDCAFTAEELQAMTAQKLEKLVLMSGEALPGRYLSPALEPSNYTGRRMPQLRIVQDENEGIPAPPDTMTLVVQRRRELGLMS
jgi:hypothetical protein